MQAIVGLMPTVQSLGGAVRSVLGLLQGSGNAGDAPPLRKVDPTSIFRICMLPAMTAGTRVAFRPLPERRDWVQMIVQDGSTQASARTGSWDAKYDIAELVAVVHWMIIQLRSIAGVDEEQLAQKSPGATWTEVVQANKTAIFQVADGETKALEPPHDEEADAQPEHMPEEENPAVDLLRGMREGFGRLVTTYEEGLTKCQVEKRNKFMAVLLILKLQIVKPLEESLDFSRPFLTELKEDVAELSRDPFHKNVSRAWHKNRVLLAAINSRIIQFTSKNLETRSIDSEINQIWDLERRL